MRNSVPHMKTSLCANVQLNRSNFDFNLKSSLTPFFHRALHLFHCPLQAPHYEWSTIILAFLMVWFQKVSILDSPPPPQEVIGDSQGLNQTKTNLFEEKYEAKLEFPEGEMDVKQKIFRGVSMDFFLELNIKSLSSA